MTNLELLQEQLAVDSTENNSKSASNNTESEKVNQQIGRTPLVARQHEGQWFATIGNYKVSGMYESYNDLERNHTNKQITWEDIAFVTAAMQDFNQLQFTTKGEQE